MGDESIEKRVTALECEVKDIKGTCTDISNRLIRMEENLKNSNTKMGSFDKYAEAIIEMSGSIKLLTERVSDVLIKLDKQDTRIDILEGRPGKFALNSWKVIIMTLITAIIGVGVELFKKGGK